MLKRSIASLALASVATFTPVGAEEKGTYFVGSIGAGQMADIDIAARLGGGDFEFDSGFSGEFGIGYDFGKFRTEFTYNGTNTDLTTVQGVSTDIGVDVSTWMVSGAYDWRADKKWHPYLGAGIGESTIEATEDLDIYGEVWSLAFDDFTIGTLEFKDCGMTGVSLGLRYKL